MIPGVVIPPYTGDLGPGVLTFDLETTLDHNTIHFSGMQEWNDTIPFAVMEGPEFNGYVKAARYMVGHNSLGFDAPVCARVWGTDWSGVTHIDTMVLARLLRPDYPEGHSAKVLFPWVGEKKADIAKEAFDGPVTQEMLDYGLQDINGTTKLAKYLLSELGRLGFSDFSIWLEHAVAPILKEQEQWGAQLDVPYATAFLAEITAESTAIHDHIVSAFEPTEVVMKTKTKYIPFNPASRPQIAARMMARGWKPKKWTEPTTNFPEGQAVIKESDLDEMGAKYPEIAGLNRYFKLNKTIAEVAKWLRMADATGRVHGWVNPCGTVTGRMTHSNPNLGQVPSVDHKAPVMEEDLGWRCRRCWIVLPGYVLVGVDASGLELRLLAHYARDLALVEQIVSGDIHTYNMHAAGLPSRDIAKTWIYAWLYGAGAAKLAAIAGCSASQAKAMADKFLTSIPSIKKLKAKIDRLCKKGWLQCLDGRQIKIRSPHSALNAILQGAGAVVMKVALVLLDREIKANGWDAHFVFNVHDEWQIETLEAHVEAVTKAALWAIEEAGKILNLRCPMKGEAKDGPSWAHTH